MSFLAGTLGLDLAGVIGLYGTLVGPWRNDAPEPVALAVDASGRRCSGLFGGADGAITAEHVAAFETALTAAGVEHRLVTYAGAPHSFFDRKAAEFAEASAAAWDEIVAFVGDGAAGAVSAWPGSRRRRRASTKMSSQNRPRAGPGCPALTMPRRAAADGVERPRDEAR